MQYNLKNIQEADIQDKIILVRLDLDIPLENKKIQDDTRLLSGIETLNFLLGKVRKIIICGHLGRPVGFDPNLSLHPIAEWFKNEFKIKDGEFSLEKKGEFIGWQIGKKMFLLENIRFFEEEEKNDLAFAKKLAAMVEVFVNDAFADSHRSHASIVGITKYLPSYAGLHLQKEVEELSRVLKNPIRPLTIIIGGAKIETKLPLISKMHNFANFVLIGGEVAKHTKELLKIEHQKSGQIKSIIEIADLTENGKDIDKYSINNFLKLIYGSKTVIWNGPMGEFEKGFDLGTKEIACGIIKAKIESIVGGGDTTAFLRKEKILEKFSFVSTGGGAMLEFLSGEKLPGLEALIN